MRWEAVLFHEAKGSFIIWAQFRSEAKWNTIYYTIKLLHLFRSTVHARELLLEVSVLPNGIFSHGLSSFQLLLLISFLLRHLLHGLHSELLSQASEKRRSRGCNLHHYSSLHGYYQALENDVSKVIEKLLPANFFRFSFQDSFDQSSRWKSTSLKVFYLYTYVCIYKFDHLVISKKIDCCKSIYWRIRMVYLTLTQVEFQGGWLSGAV